MSLFAVEAKQITVLYAGVKMQWTQLPFSLSYMLIGGPVYFSPTG